MDVAEIRLEPLPRKMRQRNEGFLMSESVFEQVTLHLGIAAAVAMFVAKATTHLRGSMPLLGRGGLVVAEDLVDDRLKWSQDRCGPIPGRGNELGLRMFENLANGVA